MPPPPRGIPARELSDSCIRLYPQPGKAPGIPTGLTRQGDIPCSGITTQRSHCPCALAPVLAAQMQGVVPRGKGLLIRQVEPGSPATSAGLQAFDILLSYDDQKLFSPDQLSALVSLDQPGRDVVPKLVRGGKPQELTVSLGEVAPLMAAPWPWQTRPFHFPRHGFPVRPDEGAQTVTKTFESLNVERLENGRYRAAIEYQDANGNTKRHGFEGSRDELIAQIRQSPDLSPAARAHLLNALNMRGSWPAGPIVARPPHTVRCIAERGSRALAMREAHRERCP